MMLDVKYDVDVADREKPGVPQIRSAPGISFGGYHPSEGAKTNLIRVRKVGPLDERVPQRRAARTG